MSWIYYGCEMLFSAAQAWLVLMIADGLFDKAWQRKQRIAGQWILIILVAAGSLWSAAAHETLLSDVMPAARFLLTTAGTILFYYCNILHALCLNVLGWGCISLINCTVFAFSSSHSWTGLYFLTGAALIIPAGTALNRWLSKRRQELSKYRNACFILTIPVLFSVFCFHMFPPQTQNRWAMFLLCCILLFLAGLAFLAKQEADFENHMLLLKATMLERQYQELLEPYRERMILIHDMKNHIRSIGEMIKQGKTENAEDYVSQITRELAGRKNHVWSNHNLMNVILNAKFEDAENAQIKVSCSCDDMSGLTLSSIEMCALFANLLDNAVEAARKCPPDREPRINLQCAKRERMLILSLSNSMETEKSGLRETPFRTTKADREHHGFGMASIRKVVDSHGGNITITKKNGEFHIEIILAAF